MARQPPSLPPSPPHDQELLTLLDRMCGAVLIVDGEPHPPMERVIDAVMQTRLAPRVVSASSAFAGRTAAWVMQHRDDLAGSLVHAVVLWEQATAIRLATRLLLLAPRGIDPAWLRRVSTNATRLAQDKHRFTEAAVLHELTARHYLADSHLDLAEDAHDAEQQALLSLPVPDRRGRALSALAWRRVGLYWSRDDHTSTVRQLDLVARHLHLDPDPTARLVQQIARGEVLHRMGRDDLAAPLLLDAIATHHTDTALVERVDAGITAGHALRSRGSQVAIRQWIRTRDLLQAALSSYAALTWDHDIRDRLSQRDDHLTRLITWPDDAPPHRAEFTILGPAGTRTIPNTATNGSCH